MEGFSCHSSKRSDVSSLSFNIIIVLCVYTCKLFSPTMPILSCILTSCLNQGKFLVKNVDVQLQVYNKFAINVAKKPLDFSSKNFYTRPNPDLPRNVGKQIPLALH